jgi:hypothetical protein
MKRSLLIYPLLLYVTSAFSQLPVSTAQQNRKILLEEFTGMYCTFCPTAHKTGDELTAADPSNIFVIAIHAGQYANPGYGAPDFRTEFGAAIVNQAKIYGYPAGTINRHYFGFLKAQNSNDPGTALYVTSFSNCATEISALPSVVNVALQGTVDPQSRLLTVKMEVYYTGTSTVSANYFHLALLQDSVMGPQTGAATYYPSMMVGSQYCHNKMLRHLITGPTGDMISNPGPGKKFAKTYTYTVPAQLPLSVAGTAIKTSVLLSKLRLVGFVTESQQEVLSANKGPLTIGTVLTATTSTTTTSVYEYADEFSVTVFPNPSNGKSTVALLLGREDNVTVKLINMLGAEEFSYEARLEKGIHSVDINGSKLSAGIYFVQVVVGNKTTVEKLIVR